MIPIYLMQDNQPFRLDLLVIGGGGGGGQGAGGGGGGGGYLCTVSGEQSGGPSTALDPIVFIGGQTITVTVGAGGGTNTNGNNSVFGDLVAIGGGRGGGIDVVAAGNGGSGGGGVLRPSTDGGDGTFGQGNDGSDFVTTGENFPVTYQSGAGGGASTASVTSFDAGFGISSSITGSSVARAGGGGGSAGTGNGRGGYGRDGGGDGSRNDAQGGASSQATAGVVNTGGGGGGGYDQSFPSKAGGSGLIVVRYSSRARVIEGITPGLTFSYSNDGTFHRYVFTAGTGSIRF